MPAYWYSCNRTYWSILWLTKIPFHEKEKASQQKIVFI